MKVKIEVSIKGRPVGTSMGYDETELLSSTVDQAATEIGHTPFSELTVEHVDALRTRLTVALRETGKRVQAELDILEEAAGGRDAQRAKDEREERLTSKSSGPSPAF